MSNDIFDYMISYYSDLDIAKVIKAASEKSLDVVTVAKDGKF